jgi:hypothetical protein
MHSDSSSSSSKHDSNCDHVLSSLPSFTSSLLAASEYMAYGTNAFDVVTILIGTTTDTTTNTITTNTITTNISDSTTVNSTSSSSNSSSNNSSTSGNSNSSTS